MAEITAPGSGVQSGGTGTGESLGGMKEWATFAATEPRPPRIRPM
jgi:hypothetical protein